jgi:hypothetical protein
MRIWVGSELATLHLSTWVLWISLSDLHMAGRIRLNDAAKCPQTNGVTNRHLRQIEKYERIYLRIEYFTLQVHGFRTACKKKVGGIQGLLV